MAESVDLRATVVNFNAPELNQLALALSTSSELNYLVRPYLNQGRWWERLIARIPALRSAYQQSFGRRLLPLADGYGRVVEVGVCWDILAALVARAPIGSVRRRERWSHLLQEKLRRAISRRAVSCLEHATHVVAYPGFAAMAFRRAERTGARRILSYPIAHHRHHLTRRNEEADRVPEFSATWPPLDHFTASYLKELDDEIACADLIVVGSAYAKRTFVEEGVSEQRIVVCPYGVDLSAFDRLSAPVPNRFRVVFAGQIGQRKGLSYLLEAYRQFEKPDSELFLIGRPVGSVDWPERYRHFIQHVPHLTRPALARTFSDCDVFVFPTLVEGMPLTVVEAMAAGLPVIATRNGPDEIVRDGIDGFLVPDRDPEAITACLNKLYADPTLRQQMSRSAAERARQFSWLRFSDQCRQILRATV